MTLAWSASAIESPAARLQSHAAQTQTVKAIQLINQNQWTLGERAIANTRDPLAAKLYQWMQLTKRENVGSYTNLAQFIRQNPEWPGIPGLKAKAEKAIPSNLTNAEVIAWFRDYEPKTASGIDRYLKALLNVGRKEEAQDIMRKWWGDIRLSRDEQKMLYSKYGSLLDAQAHRRRLDTLLFSEQYTNARAIAGVLGPGYPELTEARIALAADKPGVNGLIAKVPANLQKDPGLLFERLRWRRKNDADAGAIEILKNAPSADRVQNPKDWWNERHIIIRRLIEKRQYNQAYVLASKHIQTEGFAHAQAEWVAGWLALRFVNKPTKAFQHFEALYNGVETPVSVSRAAYWAGRAAEDFPDPVLAKSWYEKAAKFQTVYYGQLAGAKLGLKESLPNAAPPVISAQDDEAFDKRELIQAARLFSAAGAHNDSTRFLTAFVDHEQSPKAYRYAAELAIELQNFGDAVKISKDATSKGLFLTAQSYPMITNELRGVVTEWALVHSLIRQESQFDARARSPVGAQGLMQLMPATARETARKLGIAHEESWLYLRPSHNIKLGTAYIDQMLRRFDNSYPLAIAAYNAGPGRVDKWLKIYGDPRKGEIDWIDWIELIPIYETRNYVQRVLESVYVYRLRLKGIQSSGEPPIHIALAR